VRVVDQSGKMLGIMKISEALQLSLDQELDLVEISPQANPPVVKLLDYDKYRYQQEKLVQAAKKKVRKIALKEIRLSVRIGEHDLNFKAKKADEFLSEGNKVKVDVIMRGREQAHPELAFDLVKKFQATLTQLFLLESGPNKTGNTVSFLVAPKVQA
jgi:translation initiation factor IF-3